MPEGQKEEKSIRNLEVVKFKYTKVVADHYIYMGAAENHISLSHDGKTKHQIGLESAWGITWRPI